MKKIAKYLAMALSILCVVSCEQGLEEEMPLQFVPKGEIIMDEAQEDLQFSGNYEVQVLKFNANDEWKIITTRDWVTFSYFMGEAGDHEVEIYVDKSYEDEPREAALTFVIEKLRKQISLTQARGNVMKPAQYSYYLDSLEPAQFDVDVDYNVAYDIEITYDKYATHPTTGVLDEWLTIDGDVESVPSPGEETTTMTLGMNVTENETYNVRTATVRLFNEELDSEEIFTVSQVGTIPIILTDVDSQSETLTAIEAGNENTFFNYEYTYPSKIGYDVTDVTFVSADGDIVNPWLFTNTNNSVLDTSEQNYMGYDEYNKFTLSFLVDNNTDKSATRTAIVKLRNDDWDVTKYIYITQDEYNDDMRITITEAGTLSTLLDEAIAANTNLLATDYNRLYIDGAGVNLNSTDLASIYSKLSGLKYVDLSNTATTEILTGAFNTKKSLQQISLPETLESIGDGAFNATGLTSIVIPGSCKSLGQTSFSNNDSLIEVHISEGVESIGIQAFNGCDYLETVYIPSTITTWVQDDGGANKAFVNCVALKNVTLAEGLNSVGVMAFLTCTALEEIYLPGSIIWQMPSTTSTLNKAFTQCTSLRKVTVGEGMKSMVGSLFVTCPVLEYIYMPVSVPEFGTLGSIGAYVGTTYLYVPSESYDAYMISGWSASGCSIQAYD